MKTEFLKGELEKPFRKRVSVLIVKGNEVLVSSHKAYAPFTGIVHDFPGGGVEDGQTPEEAAIAEAKEEVGVRIKNVRLIPGCPIHREPFPPLKPGQGTPVQIERRKKFAGVESVSYVADYDGKVNNGKGSAEDATEWKWMNIKEAIALMHVQTVQREGNKGGMYSQMEAAIRIVSTM